MGATITVEITPGCSIERASEDASRIANLLGIDVKFSFNGVECLAVPQGCADLLAQRQQDEQRRKLTTPRDWRFVSSDPRWMPRSARGEQP